MTAASLIDNPLPNADAVTRRLLLRVCGVLMAGVTFGLLLGAAGNPLSPLEWWLLPALLVLIGSVALSARTGDAGVFLRSARVQRMETLGRLVGGVAHDFNNLFGALIASLEILDDPHLDRRRRHDIVARGNEAGLHGALARLVRNAWEAQLDGGTVRWPGFEQRLRLRPGVRRRSAPRQHAGSRHHGAAAAAGGATLLRDIRLIHSRPVDGAGQRLAPCTVRAAVPLP